MVAQLNDGQNAGSRKDRIGDIVSLDLVESKAEHVRGPFFLDDANNERSHKHYKHRHAKLDRQYAGMNQHNRQYENKNDMHEYFALRRGNAFDRFQQLGVHGV